MRVIDWDAPLSEDDKAWLRDRDLHDKIAENEARFDGIESEGEDLLVEDDYDQWKAPELKEEAVKREIDITGMTKKSQVIEALRAWDKEHPDDGE